MAGDEGENWREISARLTRGRFLAGSCAGLRLIFDLNIFLDFISISISTSPTASGKGLRRLAQCVWMAGCDCRVVVFFGFSCDVEHVLAKIPIVDSSCGHTKSSPIGVG